MTATWEKPVASQSEQQALQSPLYRIRFLIGGSTILVMVVALILSGTASGVRYFINVDELINNTQYVGQVVRISGAVVGDSIRYDSQNLKLDFAIVSIPEEFGDLAKALYEAANDPNKARLMVHVDNQVKPDLLQHEAQAILTGTLGEDGIFYASELLLKCPSRYEETNPERVAKTNE